MAFFYFTMSGTFIWENSKSGDDLAFIIIIWRYLHSHGWKLLLDVSWGLRWVVGQNFYMWPLSVATLEMNIFSMVYLGFFIEFWLFFKCKHPQTKGKSLWNIYNLTSEFMYPHFFLIVEVVRVKNTHQEPGWPSQENLICHSLSSDYNNLHHFHIQTTFTSASGLKSHAIMASVPV